MFTRQLENWEDLHIIALVELDMQKMRVRIVLAREAIRERMQELGHPQAASLKFWIVLAGVRRSRPLGRLSNRSFAQHHWFIRNGRHTNG